LSFCCGIFVVFPLEYPDIQTGFRLDDPAKAPLVEPAGLFEN